MQPIQDFLSRFGFHGMPFTCEIKSEAHFTTAPYTLAVEQLARAVEKRMGGALIAPAGTGKTALLRALCARLPEARFRIHYVNVTDLSKRNLCREIAAVAGAEPAGNYPTLVRRLQQRFQNSLSTDGQRPVLILDEAHDIRPEVLGILRILTNFQMDNRLVLSLVLAGQPLLADTLRLARLEDVARRLAHYATLPLLTRPETAAYLRHRCHIAGAAAFPFEAGALEATFEIGRGNLRATDHLALKALEIAHDQDCTSISADHILQARGMLWP